MATLAYIASWYRGAEERRSRGERVRPTIPPGEIADHADRRRYWMLDPSHPPGRGAGETRFLSLLDTKESHFDRAKVRAKSGGRSRRRAEKSLEGKIVTFLVVQVNLPLRARSQRGVTFNIVAPKDSADMDVHESKNIEDGTSASREHLRSSARSAVSPTGMLGWAPFPPFSLSPQPLRPSAHLPAREC